MDIFTRDELVQDGHTEDGDINYTQHYFIVAELEDGTRYAHQHVSTDRDIIDSLAVRIEAATASKGIDALNLELWGKIDPCYGSEAHQRIGDAHLMTDDELHHNRRMGYMH